MNVLRLVIHCTIVRAVLCGVEINKRLNVEHVQPGDFFNLTCITRGSDRLTWSSEEYIGRNSLTLAINGSMLSPNNYTTITLVRFDSGGSIELVSYLSIIVQPSIPFASLTCRNDVTMEMQTVNISLIDNCDEVHAMTTVTPQVTLPDTTDVQAVQVVFFQNSLFLQCSFADSSQARGCIFKFVVLGTNGINQYNVTRRGLRGSLCTSAPYRLDAYVSVFVMDWEENGEEGNVTVNVINSVTSVPTSEEYTALTGCLLAEVQLNEANVGAVVTGTSIGVVAVITVTFVVVILLMAIILKQHGSTFFRKKYTRRIASDSGEMDDIPVLYECEINAGEFKDKMIESLARDKDEVRQKATTASGPPPPPMFSWNDKETIEMEPMESASSGPPPPIAGVIEMEPEVHDETKDVDKVVKQELNELTKEVDKRVKLEHDDPDAPLTLKVKWKSLIESLLARDDQAGSKNYNFSKLKVELEF